MSVPDGPCKCGFYLVDDGPLRVVAAQRELLELGHGGGGGVGAALRGERALVLALVAAALEIDHGSAGGDGREGGRGWRSPRSRQAGWGDTTEDPAVSSK